MMWEKRRAQMILIFFSIELFFKNYKRIHARKTSEKIQKYVKR